VGSGGGDLKAKTKSAPSGEAVAAGVHPSHDIEVDWTPPDPHNPSWRCRTCCEQACSICDLEDDDELRAPCLGYPWHEGKQATGDDGITRTVRKSGVGWF
jgi:hypothetical protein